MALGLRLSLFRTRPQLGEVNDPGRLRAICLHEFGHAIGLWGHSPDSRDAEFHTSTKEHPSLQDINTLLRVYATPRTRRNMRLRFRQSRKVWMDPPPMPADTTFWAPSQLTKGTSRRGSRTFRQRLRLIRPPNPHAKSCSKCIKTLGATNKPLSWSTTYWPATPSHDVYNTLGVMYYRVGKIEESITAFQNSINRNSHDLAAQHNLHQIYREKGIAALQAKNYTQADAYFKKALRYAARDASAVYRLMGESYEKRGDFATAVSHYQKALETNPVDRNIQDALAGCHNNHGVKLRGAKRWMMP